MFNIFDVVYFKQLQIGIYSVKSFWGSFHETIRYCPHKNSQYKIKIFYKGVDMNKILQQNKEQCCMCIVYLVGYFCFIVTVARSK